MHREGRRTGGCSAPAPRDPVNIPHDNENRGVTTEIDQGLNPQVIAPFLHEPQVTQ
jgi:hypothetical protein